MATPNLHYTVPDLSYLTPVYLTVFILGGQVLLPIIICFTVFVKDVSRHPSLTNLLISWVVYSLAYSILKYSDVENTNDTQSIVCLVQSALVHGVPPMVGMAGLIVVVQMWATFAYPQQLFNNLYGSALRIIMLVLPYIMLVAFSTAASIIAHQNPEAVTMGNGLYCTLILSPFDRFVPATCMVFLFLILGFEVATGLQDYRMRRKIICVFPLADQRTTSSSIVLRVALLSIYLVLSFVAAVFLVTDKLGDNGWPYMISASLPLAVAVVFGTQKDLYTCLGRASR